MNRNIKPNLIVAIILLVLGFFKAPGLISSEQDIKRGNEQYIVTTETETTKLPTPSEVMKLHKQSLIDYKKTATFSSIKKVAYQTQPIFIYHSHNRESWLPLLKKSDPDQAFDSNINVSLLGERMQQKLNYFGIRSIHSKTDYPTAINNFKYPRSYEYSKMDVKKALKTNPDTKFIFDIHRDSQTHGNTTIEHNNKKYAQVYFVVGQKNPNWQENMAFATKIHNALNKKYPGLSKGIYKKDRSVGNGEYNQSFSGTSSLIEIGGVENTLEENYRTVDILSSVIADLYWKSVKMGYKDQAI